MSCLTVFLQSIDLRAFWHKKIVKKSLGVLSYNDKRKHQGTFHCFEQRENGCEICCVKMLPMNLV